MLRNCACAAVLALWAGAAVADEGGKDPRKGQALTGIVKKVDPSANMVIVTLDLKKEPMDRIIKVGDATRFVFEGEKKEELIGRAAFKNPRLKEGARVRLVTDEGGKVTEVHVGPPGRSGKDGK